MKPGDEAFVLINEQAAPYLVGNRTRSTALLAWFIENVMREAPDRVEDAICDGGGDKGIDAMLIDEDSNELFVLQAKERLNPASTQGDADLRSFMGVASYFRDRGSLDQLLASSPNDELRDLVRRLRLVDRFADEGLTVRLVFVTNAPRDRAATDYLGAIRDERPTIDLWDRARIAAVARRTKRSGLLDERVTLHPEGGVITTSLADGASMALALVPASELVRIPGIENLTVFDLNVRLGLGNTKINRDLRATIQKGGEHKSFPAYHNGLTLLTNTLTTGDEGLDLDGVGVVNGCQSLLSLWRERTHITPDLNLMVKVVETGGRAALADNITYRSNNQNPINTRDLRSTDRIQQDLQAQVAERYGSRLFYDIRRGQPAPADTPVLDNQVAAQMLMAVWLGEPWAAVRKLKLFDQDYHRIFSKATGDWLFLAFLLNLAIEEKRDRLIPELQTSFASVRFTLAHLVAQIFRQNEQGSTFLSHPEKWLPKELDAVLDRVAYYVDFAVDETNYYVGDRLEERNANPDSAPFDPKTVFKSSTGVRPLERQVVASVKALDRRPNSDILFDIAEA